MTQSYNEVIPNLFVGNETASFIYGNEFETIINCTKSVSFPKSCKTCIRLAVDDTPDEAKRLYNLIKAEQVLETINNSLANNKTVLVHCHAGMQRSCTVVVCYLIKYKNMSIEEAIKLVKEKRHIAFLGSINFIETIELVYNKNKNKKIEL
jgi:protein tyrosine phosphatase